MPRTLTNPPPEQQWKLLAEQTREDAQKLPPGKARDAMLRKARQLETACHMSEWVSSPGLRPPLGK